MTQLQKIVAKAKTLRKSHPNTKWTDLIKKASKLVTPASKSVGAVKKKKSVKKYAPVKPLAKKKKSVKRSTSRSAESEKVRAKVKKDGFIMPHGYEVTKSKRVVSGIGDIGENFTRVNNDVNGNPRYVIHFMDILNTEERMSIPFSKIYEYALKKAKKIGGKKFDNKQYGGGIVFQSYNLENTWKKIQDLKHTTPKIKH